MMPAQEDHTVIMFSLNHMLDQPIPFSGSSSNNPGTDNEINISIDYAQPVSKNFLIETGVKMVDQNLTSIADVSVFNPSINQYYK